MFKICNTYKLQPKGCKNSLTSGHACEMLLNERKSLYSYSLEHQGNGKL